MPLPHIFLFFICLWSYSNFQPLHAIYLLRVACPTFGQSKLSNGPGCRKVRMHQCAKTWYIFLVTWIVPFILFELCFLWPPLPSSLHLNDFSLYWRVSAKKNVTPLLTHWSSWTNPSICDIDINVFNMCIVACTYVYYQSYINHTWLSYITATAALYHPTKLNENAKLNSRITKYEHSRGSLLFCIFVFDDIKLSCFDMNIEELITKSNKIFTTQVCIVQDQVTSNMQMLWTPQ